MDIRAFVLSHSSLTISRILLSFMPSNSMNWLYNLIKLYDPPQILILFCDLIKFGVNSSFM